VGKVAVLIPHYNNLTGLKSTLASFQPDDPADVVVVDDGSRTPPNEAELRTWVSGERKIYLVLMSKNVGIEGALNAGLHRIRELGYDYIARIDCGDANVGRRFTIQRDFLDSHPDINLVGGAAQFVDPSGAVLFVRTMPRDHAQIADFMFANSAFMHPAVMFRSRALDQVGDYPTDFPAAEDYAFFWRFVEFGEVANLPDVLITYEVSPDSISRSQRKEQLRSRLAVQGLHNDGSLRAWRGRVRTRALMLAPVGIIDRLKSRRYGQP
jgi:glycosyltransferase involved in cell wall biosynthesis